ncbi:endonuclease III [Archaeoglobales archaeon]|nr:MAG: endonuclease III [Archaeoglobales archaeon]
MSLKLEELLEVMEREAKKRNAPVFTLKGFLNDPFQHLIFAVLSSRTRDEVTVKAGKKLFSKANTPEKLAKMDVKEIEELIEGVGFYRVKAKNLKKLAEILVKDYNSNVPLSLEELTKLPGVGRKTANIVLSASNIPTIAVDTHVHRISNRLGLVKTTKPEETEEQLKKIFPKELWNRVNQAFVGFGQTVCKPVKPLCNECPIDWCPRIGLSF